MCDMCMICTEYVLPKPCMSFFLSLHPAALSLSDGQDPIQPRMDPERNVGRLIPNTRRPLTRIFMIQCLRAGGLGARELFEHIMMAFASGHCVDTWVTWTDGARGTI